MNRFMERLAVVVLLGIFLILSSNQPVLAGEVGILIEKLVEKGVLTRSEARELLKKSQKVATEEKKSADLKIYWNKGIRLSTEDKAFTFKMGGRIMNDWAFISEDKSIEDTIGDLQDSATEFRKARFYIQGTIYDRIIFKAQYDFAGGDNDFKDVYLGLKKLPWVGTLKVGHFKEPFGLEELTSSKYGAFMERGLPGVFTPSRNTGISVSKAEFNDRFTWSVGAFLDTDDDGDDNQAEHNFAAAARVTGLPWYEGNDRLLHLGTAYSYRDAKDDVVRFRQRPEAHLADFRLVDTGNINADSENRFGIEAALVYGPFSLQGEYMFTKVDTLNGSDPRFFGYYTYASYFLTGEHRVYKKSAGLFGRVKPKRNFGDRGGLGAWELALRYSGIDLSDEGIEGGELDNITLGVNWHLNPNVRTMLNYIRADLDDVGDADILQMRFQVDF